MSDSLTDPKLDCEFLGKYQRLNQGINIDSIFDVGIAQISISKDLSIYWNVAVLSKPPTSDELTRIESFFAEHDRKPVLYIPDQLALDSAMPSNYQEVYRDSWLFYPTERTTLVPGDSEIIAVNNTQELDHFVNTLRKCYIQGDPRNPHGEISDAKAEAVKKTWNSFKSAGIVAYFIIQKNNQPVAVSALISKEQLGYICLVGSLPAVAGQGFGKLATLVALNHSVSKGNLDHSLVSEEGTYPDKFYRKLGFQQRLMGIYFERIDNT